MKQPKQSIARLLLASALTMFVGLGAQAGTMTKTEDMGTSGGCCGGGKGKKTATMTAPTMADYGFQVQMVGEMKKPEVGTKAPAFTLADSAGKEHSLADFKGKNVILMWTNPACPYVVNHLEAGSYKKLHELAGEDCVMLFIDSTNPEAGGCADRSKETAEKYGLQDVPVLHDFDGKVGKAYGATNTPEAFVIDKEGTVVYAGAIDNDQNGSLEEADKVNYVADAIKAIHAGEDIAVNTTKPYGCSVKYPKEDLAS